MMLDHDLELVSFLRLMGLCRLAFLFFFYIHELFSYELNLYLIYFANVYRYNS